MKALEASTQIEDYLILNDMRFGYPHNTAPSPLIDPFCITELGVIVFNLTVNYASNDALKRTPNIQTVLLIDSLKVARSFVNDDEEPINVALSYEGVVATDVQVEVNVNSGGMSLFVPFQLL